MKYFLLLASLIIKAFVFAQPGNVDSTYNYNFYNQFRNGDGPSGIVSSIAEQTGGKILVGGNFQTFSGKYTGPFVRLNANGSIDPDFHLGYANNKINTIAIQPDSKILIGGFFTQYDGSSAYNIFRMNADGTMDDTFYANINSGSNPSWVNSIALQNDGKILVGGKFTSANGQTVGSIIRLNADGSNDPDFDTGLGCLDGQVKTIKVDQNGLILLGGTFMGFNNSNNGCVIRLLANGSVDNSFTSGLSSGDYVNALLINQDNTIYVAGRFFSYNAASRMHIVRIQPSGSIDLSFNAGQLDDEIFALEKSSGMELVISGDFTTINNQAVKRIACLNLDGTVSSTMNFGTGVSGEVTALLKRSDGKLLVGGSFANLQDYSRGNIARLHVDGNLDHSFLPVPGTDNTVNKVVMLPGNKSMIAGTFNRYNDTPCKGIVKLNVDGTVDPSFHCDADSIHYFVDLVPIPGDAYYGIAETATSSLYRLIRLFGNGQVDPSFVTSGILSNEIPQKVTFQPDGKLLVIGLFQNTAGIPVQSVIRLNPDGTREAGFLLNPIMVGGTITCVEVQDDNTILVAGDFNYPSECYSMVRYNNDGSMDPTFTRPCTGGVITRVILLEDGYFIAGNFSEVNGFATSNVARIDLDGVVVNSFSANVISYNAASDIVVQIDGKVIVAIAENSQGPLILRLNADGSSDPEFVLNGNAAGSITSLGMQTDGKIIGAGSFNGSLDWNNANGIVRLKNDVSGVSPLQIAIHAIESEVRCSTQASCTATGYLGEAPYTYSWSNGLSSDSTALFDSAGVYTCTVTDALGSSKTLTVVISGVQFSNEFDLNINFSSTNFRPGFESTVWIDAFNDGCVPVSGKLKLGYDPILSFVSALPMPDAQNGDTLIWNFTDLIYDSAHIMPHVVFLTPTSAVIGDSLKFTAMITPISGDGDTRNNLKLYNMPVVNGYDPNFKAVYPVGKCDDGYIVPNQTLTYTVHFQNTGNSEAINISVLDSLDPDLDLNTIKIVGKSHEMWTEVTSGNVLNFHFDAIHLPDSSNESGSHGYVIFEIKPQPLLPHKTAIQNSVAIYFDFNPPVLTNTVLNTIFSEGLLDFNCFESGIEENSLASVVLFPNPAKDEISVLLDVPSVILRVVDLQGKEIFSPEEIQNGGQISLKEWQTGLYFFELLMPAGKRLVKVVKD